VIPETIDCIRALTGAEEDAGTSIARTDESLGLRKHFLPRRAREESPDAAAHRRTGFKGAEEPLPPETG
jgi:hypothetical protein